MHTLHQVVFEGDESIAQQLVAVVEGAGFEARLLSMAGELMDYHS